MIYLNKDSGILLYSFYTRYYKVGGVLLKYPALSGGVTKNAVRLPHLAPKKERGIGKSLYRFVMRNG